jgi:hypothetical protein
MLLCGPCGSATAFHGPVPRRASDIARARHTLALDEAELSRKFVQQASSLFAAGESRLTPVLRPDETAAEDMSVEQVVRHVMDAFRPDDEDGWQFSNTQAEVAGAAFKGSRVLMSFSAKTRTKLDELGQLQPGAFERPTLLEKYLKEHSNYRSLALLSEWKAVAAPEKRIGDDATADSADASRVVQKLLVRQEGCNWEELRMVLECRQTSKGQRWLVTSIYKDYHDPAGRGIDEIDENPEESRNC